MIYTENHDIETENYLFINVKICNCQQEINYFPS